jgi:hypothetical protein
VTGVQTCALPISAALGITTIEYNNLWQSYRDQIEYSWKTGENALDRENELARQVLAKQATIEAAKFQIEAAKYQALGSLAAQVFDKGNIAKAIGSGLMTAGAAAGGLVTGAITGIQNLFSSSSTGYQIIPNEAEPGDPAYGWNYYGDGTNNVSISPDNAYYYNGDLVWYPDMPLSGMDPDNPYSTTGGMEGE